MSATTNMVLIETKTAGSGGVSNFDFTGIAASFTDLKLVISFRSNSTSDTDDPITVAFNNVTTGFTSRTLTGSGSLAESQSSSLNRIRVDVPTTVSTSNVFCNASVYIPNYAGATNKSFSVDGVNENNTTNAYFGGVIGAYLWSNTAAITSIKLSPTEGTLWLEGSTASLYGIKSTSNLITAKATGGIIYQSGAYIYHAFLASGTFTPTAGTLSCDVLMVAGGGGGYDYTATGGGGAGGVVYTSATSVSSALTIGVGAGGYNGGSDPSTVANGGNTTVTGLTTAVGGGHGSTTNGSYTATSGGSGGGGSSGYQTPGSGTSGQGYAGGNGMATGTPAYAGGGGGGAGAAGSTGVDQGAYSSTGGAGGVGTSTYSAFGLATGTGEVVGGVAYFAGGGGGNGSNARGAGGSGGGGGNTRALGLPGTGGGGAPSGNGGSGIVIVRYAA